MTDYNRTPTAADAVEVSATTPLLGAASARDAANDAAFSASTAAASAASADLHLFSPENPIPLWYRLFLPIIEPLTTVIALYQLLFHPQVYLSETTPAVLAVYTPRMDTLFTQLALSMAFTVYVESYLFGYRWPAQADEWQGAVVLLLAGDALFNFALFQGNEWTWWWAWGQFKGANVPLLISAAVMGVLGPVTRVLFLLRVGFSQGDARAHRD